MRRIQVGEVCVPAGEIAQRALLIGLDASGPMVGQIAKALGLDYQERTDELTISGRNVTSRQRLYSEADVPLLMDALRLRADGLQMAAVVSSLVDAGKIEAPTPEAKPELPPLVTKAKLVDMVKQLADELALHEPSSALVRKARRMLA